MTAQTPGCGPNSEARKRAAEGAVGETDYIETDLIEWAIQCHTRDGDLHTGRHFVTEREAIESGERLERINGAEWWLVSRRRVVTVETSPWAVATTPERRPS